MIRTGSGLDLEEQVSREPSPGVYSRNQHRASNLHKELL